MAGGGGLACGALLGIDDGQLGAASAESGADGTAVDAGMLDGGAPDGAPSDAALVDGPPDVVAECVPLGDSGCPSSGGPTMVRVTSTLCIDSTEVTNLQYAAFLDAGTPPPPPAVCSWKANNIPDNWSPQPSDDLPVVGVDWCDAYAFCAWAGKHLCGNPDGGPTPFARNDTASVNAWYWACSNNGNQAYPYGNAYMASYCNGQDLDANMLLPVGSLTSCQMMMATYCGVFDQCGNAQEWLDSCDDGNDAGALPSDASCSRQGGSFYKPHIAPPDDPMSCAGITEGPRSERGSDIGFRCCSP
jgi:formylglycine-generating enzyme required for sulfatase activity